MELLSHGKTSPELEFTHVDSHTSEGRTGGQMLDRCHQNAIVLTTLLVIYFEIAQVQYQKVHCNKCSCSSVEKK